jgi:hypothetical protein
LKTVAWQLKVEEDFEVESPDSFEVELPDPMAAVYLASAA